MGACHRLAAIKNGISKNPSLPKGGIFCCVIFAAETGGGTKKNNACNRKKLKTCPKNELYYLESLFVIGEENENIKMYLCNWPGPDPGARSL
jgi:hypothetical protein